MSKRSIEATRQLAKRQYTWLRAEPDCRWLCDGESLLQRAIAELGPLCG
jgi:tRNA dimethylallyltransferase